MTFHYRERTGPAPPLFPLVTTPLRLCPECRAAVPEAERAAHHEWHRETDQEGTE